MGCARVDGAVDARCDATSARETDVGARRPRPYAGERRHVSEHVARSRGGGFE